MTGLETAFPEQFDFYHLGQVSAAPGNEDVSPELFEDQAVISFAFHGDFNGVLFLLVEDSLDRSLYSEMGNLIASMIANRLAAPDGIGVMPSPPREIPVETARRTASIAGVSLRRDYFHQTGKSVIPVTALLIPDRGAHYA